MITGSHSSKIVFQSSSCSSKSKTSSADVLADILILPRPAAWAMSKRKLALNSKAVCITEDEVLEE